MSKIIKDLSEGLLSGLLNPITNTIQKGMEGKQKAEQMASEIVSQVVSIVEKTNAGQVEINKIDAQSNSIFKSGWRPFAGWGLGFLMQAMIVTMLLHSYFPDQVEQVPMPVFAIVAGTWSSLAGIRQVDKWILNKGVKLKK